MPDRPDVRTWALQGADWMASRSKDPGRRVGAIILRPDNTIASAGYNGFPRNVRDDPNMLADKPTKLRRTVHAELNAILTAREPLHGYTIYVSPLHPCSQCAAAIIQAGIRKVVARICSDGGEGWRESFAEASEMFAEAGVEVETIETVNKENGDGSPDDRMAGPTSMDVGSIFRPRGWPVGL